MTGQGAHYQPLQRQRRRANSLRPSAQVSRQRWGEVQNNWKSHIDAVRQNADEAKANLDAKVLVRRADRAEDDAAAAVEFAYAAFEEAEYQVLNAALARMDADAASAEWTIDHANAMAASP